MKFVYFTHSLVSCWNHGNAHFQRGLLRALLARGHRAASWEPADGWSRQNLIADQGEHAMMDMAAAIPGLDVGTYRAIADIEAAVDGADVVIVHEWNDPAVVAEIGRLRRHARFRLLFHDTHHRAVSDPQAMRRFDLSHYDAVLAFGATLAEVYRTWGWGERVFVWHEAADTALFRPPFEVRPRDGIVWIGNWGDGERSAELEDFLLRPAQEAGLALDIHGVRYPADAQAMLARHHARYRGWIANAAVPALFAQAEMTVHVPRRFYTEMLPGIPTIRVFEALACGIPLLSAPWSDSEELFREGVDYLVAHDGAAMRRHMAVLHADPEFAAAMAASGRQRILERHSCDIRAGELLDMLARLEAGASVSA